MAWNVFKFCTGLRVVGSIMILVVLAVVSVSYYAVVVSNYGLEILKGGSTAIPFVVLLLFHVLVRKGSALFILPLLSQFPFACSWFPFRNW